MARLEELTVSLLNDLAKECNLKFEEKQTKRQKIEIIKKAGIDSDKLESLIKKYKEKKSRIKKGSTNELSELKGRVRLLEDQIKFLMSMISVSEVSVSKEKDDDIITIVSNLSDIKKFIKSLVVPGEAISIDELIESKEIQKIPLVTLKHAVYDLIEEEVFKIAEGNSHQKIGGKIGVIKRR